MCCLQPENVWEQRPPKTRALTSTHSGLALKYMNHGVLTTELYKITSKGSAKGLKSNTT